MVVAKGHEAAGGGDLQCVDGAGSGAASVDGHRDVAGIRGTEDIDPLACQPGAAVPHAGVAILLRLFEGGIGGDRVAAMHGLQCHRCGSKDCQSHASGGVEGLSVDLTEGELDGELLLLLADVAVGPLAFCQSYSVVADDLAGDGVCRSIGEGDEIGMRSRVRLDFRDEPAEEEPCRQQWEQRQPASARKEGDGA